MAYHNEILSYSSASHCSPSDPFQTRGFRAFFPQICQVGDGDRPPPPGSRSCVILLGRTWPAGMLPSGSSHPDLSRRTTCTPRWLEVPPCTSVYPRTSKQPIMSYSTLLMVQVTTVSTHWLGSNPGFLHTLAHSHASWTTTTLCDHAFCHLNGCYGSSPPSAANHSRFLQAC